MHPVRMKLLSSGIVRASCAVNQQTRKTVAAQQAVEARRRELLAQKQAKACAILNAAVQRGIS